MSKIVWSCTPVTPALTSLDMVIIAPYAAPGAQHARGFGWNDLDDLAKHAVADAMAQGIKPQNSDSVKIDLRNSLLGATPALLERAAPVGSVTDRTPEPQCAVGQGGFDIDDPDLIAAGQDHQGALMVIGGGNPACFFLKTKENVRARIPLGPSGDDGRGQSRDMVNCAWCGTYGRKYGPIIGRPDDGMTGRARRVSRPRLPAESRAPCGQFCDETRGLPRGHHPSRGHRTAGKGIDHV